MLRTERWSPDGSGPPARWPEVHPGFQRAGPCSSTAPRAQVHGPACAPSVRARPISVTQLQNLHGTRCRRICAGLRVVTNGECRRLANRARNQQILSGWKRHTPLAGVVTLGRLIGLSRRRPRRNRNARRSPSPVSASAGQDPGPEEGKGPEEPMQLQFERHLHHDQALSWPSGRCPGRGGGMHAAENRAAAFAFAPPCAHRYMARNKPQEHEQHHACTATNARLRRPGRPPPPLHGCAAAAALPSPPPPSGRRPGVTPARRTAACCCCSAAGRAPPAAPPRLPRGGRLTPCPW
jgi:hypothetical protein